MQSEFPPTGRTRVRRKAHRAAYDARVVHAILDAGIVAHIGYLHEGQPVCTPTAYWREGGHVHWHGAAPGRAMGAQAGEPVCFTVSHLDGLVLGRSGFTHSIMYRSVMAFGRPEAITDPAAKGRAMDALLDRLYPGRSREIRPAHESELAAITVLRLALEEVSAKVREPGVIDREADLSAPCWAGVIPIAVTVGNAQPDPRQAPAMRKSPAIAAYLPGAPLEAALVAGAWAGRQQIDAATQVKSD